ncbi:MAG TPA: PhzF family phenazine biosynthesis protein [Solirubrobacteraceae bacterium]|nr:PhzF family phenazine biosynthesis protein [Solirubrobacteraceae bacterium]
MQATARELRLSETVFLLPGDGASCDAIMRIFTPETELPFAGHPTLGAAFVVGARKELTTVRLMTGAGLVPVTLEREHNEIVYGEMEQPLPTVAPFAQAEPLLAALGVSEAALPVEVYVNGPQHVMVALESPEQVAELKPDLGALAGFDGAVTVSCFAKTGESEVKTRVFCPAAGVPEDPATGSAAGPLALHLVRHGRAGFGQTLTISQGSEIHRPSQLYARVEGVAEQVEQVIVGGGAVFVAHGHFRLA